MYVRRLVVDVRERMWAVGCVAWWCMVMWLQGMVASMVARFGAGDDELLALWKKEAAAWC